MTGWYGRSFLLEVAKALSRYQLQIYNERDTLVLIKLQVIKKNWFLQERLRSCFFFFEASKKEDFSKTSKLHSDVDYLFCLGNKSYRKSEWNEMYKLFDSHKI